MTDANAYLHFDGTRTYIEVPSSPDFSVAVGGALTVSAWIRPKRLCFAKLDQNSYVHWLGKGEPGRHEWTFRMYSAGNPEGRGNRISFYVFNPAGGKGVGSYFQDELQPGQWIHVVGAADSQRTYIYRDGVKRDSDVYTGNIIPQAGDARRRIGTRDLRSFFEGEIRAVRVWNRLLTDAEVADLHNADVVPTTGLVAEYLLSRDVACDSAGTQDGTIFAPVWIPQYT
jgi:hypothetical protein